MKQIVFLVSHSLEFLVLKLLMVLYRISRVALVHVLKSKLMPHYLIRFYMSCDAFVFSSFESVYLNSAEATCETSVLKYSKQSTNPFPRKIKPNFYSLYRNY